MKNTGKAAQNPMLYHFAGVLFLIAAAVDKNVIYCAIGVCFFVLGIYNQKRRRR
ncbi:MAG: hypothetical protein IJC54_06280 [Clostridia bacterium]|nr:hypothetical protein [Clostridia bacterium]